MRYAANQEVVYIGPDWRRHPFIIQLGMTVPAPGRVYTIRDWMIVEPGPNRFTSGWHYLLNEIKNEVRDTFDLGVTEQGWVVHAWLRPVEKKSSAIEELMKLQDPANHKELEGV